MVSLRSVIVSGVSAFVLLALTVGLIAFSFGDHDTKFTPSPTKEVFDWLYTVALRYRVLAAALLGCSAGAMAVVTVRRSRSMLTGRSGDDN